MALEFAPDDVQTIAIACLGEPNRALSKPGELRFGSHGSMSVDLQKATWHDFSEGTGGGILKPEGQGLVERCLGKKGRDAVEFIRSLGVNVPERDAPRLNGGAIRNGASNEAAKVGAGDAPKRQLVATYDYRDERGELLYQACRYEPKTFMQRRPDGQGGWSWSVKGVRQVPYRLGELQEAIREGAIVFVCEGEKDCDNLAKLGVPATTNAAGACKFVEDLVPYFDLARVAILPDNDEVGRKHGLQVANRLRGTAESIRIVELPRLPEKGDVSDWLAAGGTVEELYRLVGDAPEWQPSADAPWDGEGPYSGPDAHEGGAPGPFRSHFGAMPLAAIYEPGPEYEHLIKGVLTRGEVSMLVGPSGSGKSFLATHASLCIARGVEFLPPIGRPAPRVRRGGVLYIAGEGARGLKKRLRAYLQHYCVNPADIPFVLLTQPVDLHGGDQQTEWLIEEARHHGAAFLAKAGVPLELVVIDTLSASTPGANENASDDVSRVLGRCHRLARECSTAVMLVHHMRADGQRERGHSSLRANVDSVIEVQKTEARDAHPPIGRIIRTAKITKQKDGADELTFRFVLPSVTLGEDEDGDPITSCIVAPPDLGEYDDGAAGEKDKAPRLSTQMALVLRAIDDAIGEMGQAPPETLRLPRSLRVVEWKHVRTAYARISSEGDGEPDEEKKAAAVRQALKRGGDELLRRKIIGRSNPWIWRTGKRAAGEAAPRDPADTSSHVLPFDRQIDDAIPLDLLDP